MIVRGRWKDGDGGDLVVYDRNLFLCGEHHVPHHEIKTLYLSWFSDHGKVKPAPGAPPNNQSELLIPPNLRIYNVTAPGARADSSYG
jgi:hypothetical protein